MNKDKVEMPDGAVNPASPVNALVPLAELAEGQTVAKRDNSGRFLTGNSGGGRPKGSRNRLTDTFLSAIADDFAINGTEAIEQVRKTDPGSYLKLVSSLIPRQLVLQRERQLDFSDMTFTELQELLTRNRHNRNVQKMIDTAQ